VSDYRKALDLDESFTRAKEGLQTAQKRQKQVFAPNWLMTLINEQLTGREERSLRNSGRQEKCGQEGDQQGLSEAHATVASG